MYINASNERNHLQNLYIHVHYYLMHTQYYTYMHWNALHNGAIYVSPSICGICLHSVKMVILWAWVYQGFT